MLLYKLVYRRQRKESVVELLARCDAEAIAVAKFSARCSAVPEAVLGELGGKPLEIEVLNTGVENLPPQQAPRTCLPEEMLVFMCQMEPGEDLEV